MANIKKMFITLVTFAFISGSLLVGCGGLSDEELAELKSLEDQVAALKDDVKKMEDKKADLQKQIQQKDNEIKAKQKLIDAVKNCK
jgi:septal ring factor EnvC (AmiA/AmiB activator)